MSELVSILIPVYNRDQFIGKTIESALSQSYRNIEVIIVDNASTDRTWEIILDYASKDKRIRCFRNEKNIGPVRNWLACLEKARGFYCKILWSDDLINTNYVSRCLEIFDSEVGFVTSSAFIFSEDKKTRPLIKYKLKKEGKIRSNYYLKNVLIDNRLPVSPGCAIFRKSDLQKSLLLDVPNQANSDFSMHAIGNDLLLFLNVARDYKYFGHIQEPLSLFRHHKSSISATSGSAKLVLHYAAAKAFFVENLFEQNKPCLAAYISICLYRFRNVNRFGFDTINHFFTKEYKVSKFCILYILFLKIFQFSISRISLFNK